MMFPFDVDPDWYDRYWMTDRPQPRRRSFSRSLTRFAVVVVLMAGGGAALSHFYPDHGAAHYQGWEQE